MPGGDPFRRTFYQSTEELAGENPKFFNPPCCVMVARVLVRNAQMEALFKVGSDWWKDANLWDQSKPYSSVHAAAEVKARFTGTPAQVIVLQPESGLPFGRVKPHLTKGRWYAVQGWRSDETGHAFLLELSPTRLEECRVLQSSMKYGLRVNDERWEDIEELPGYILTADFLRQFDAGIGLTELW